jgi:hypothetical protein
MSAVTLKTERNSECLHSIREHKIIKSVFCSSLRTFVSRLYKFVRCVMPVMPVNKKIIISVHCVMISVHCVMISVHSVMISVHSVMISVHSVMTATQPLMTGSHFLRLSKLPRVYGTQMFIALFTISSHLRIHAHRSMQSILFKINCDILSHLRLVLSSGLLPSWLHAQHFADLFSTIRAIFPSVSCSFICLP